MGALRALAGLFVLIATSACGEPLPSSPEATPDARESPLPPASDAASEVAVTSPSAQASPESCTVIMASPKGAYRFPTPEEALAAFADAWRKIGAEAGADPGTKTQADEIVATAARATFTSRDEDTATAETASRDSVATYQFGRTSEGWGIEGMSLPLPAAMCKLR